MKFAKLTIAASLAMLLGGAAVAQASEPSTLADCTTMKKKAYAALSANEQSPNYSQARNLAESGGRFCSIGVYGVGVSQFAKVLNLLGAG